MTFPNRTNNGYHKLSKEQSSGNVWLLIVGFFCMCFAFGVFSFYWRHQIELHSWSRLHLKHSQIPPLNSFPPGFLIGCASSAYQFEGAWNVDGKGENIWDILVHRVPSIIKNNDTGDVACDSYNKYKEDVQLIKNIGFTHYRFSISWSRVMPTGHDDVINRLGLQYYHNLIDELLANGIQPMIVLYHWDLPQPLQDIGGWPNPLLANYFETYARIIFQEFAPKVKLWNTINEPRNIVLGYGYTDGEVIMAPLVRQTGIANYLATHTLLRAHAKAYRLYDREFRPTYGGRITITLDAQYYEPLSDSKEDAIAAAIALEFSIDLFAHPIFSKEGDYPKSIKERIKQISNSEGRSVSRLPTFTPAEVKEIQGTYDFFSVNHYTTHLTTPGYEPGSLEDAGVKTTSDPSWPVGSSSWLQVVPWGLRKMLNYIKVKYNNPPIFITENGFSSDKEIEDYDRIQYHHDYMEQMLLAIHEDNCNVIGYTVWSILDNFEWGQGYSDRFGLYFVNFTDPQKKRTKKLSADYFKKMLEQKILPDIDKTVTSPYSIKVAGINDTLMKIK